MADSSDPARSVASINSLLGACVRSFGNILRLPLHNNDDYVKSAVDLHEELGRLRLWAGNLGAHRKHGDRLSLDHRLREAPELHKLVSEHLSDIFQGIKIASTIIADGGVDSGDHDGQQLLFDSDDSDSDETWSIIKDDKANFSEIREHLLDIRHAITSLYKFSVTIFNPARRDVSKKAAKISLRHFEIFDIQHVCGKFSLPTDSALAQRLGKANTRRREILAYYRTHGDKISKYIDVFIDEAFQSHQVSGASRFDTAANLPASASGPGDRNAAHSTMSTEWTQDTSVSTFRMADIEIVSDAGRTVFSVPSSTAGDETLTPLPSIPETATENMPFICSICCQTITLKRLPGAWEYHVYSDLRPYICTFGNCVQADQLYDSYTEWSEHERSLHRREWMCNFCSLILDSPDVLRRHIQSAHLYIAPKAQLESMIRLSERAITTAQQCPLCSKPPIPDPNRFQRHLARHLRQVSLFTLPRAAPDDAAPAPFSENSNCTALRNLQRGLKKYRLESFVDRRLEFVAGPIVQRLVEDNIEAILKEGSLGDVEHISSLSQLISKHATRLFAILVELRREEYILPLLREGIQDDNLPFQRVQISTLHTMALVTRQGTNIHALRNWDNETITNLVRKQYRVLSPIFRRGEHYELDDFHILPFLGHEADHDGKASAAGGYGEVFRACIHPDNHELERSSVRPRRGLFVAVKLLFHNDDFQSERNVYRALGHLSHDHLIDLLFTYKIKNRYHLVFPWADGSLKDYWENYPKPAFTYQNILWSVEQMKGIASGLAYFHEFTNPEHGQTRFGRHGDIKAQNILWFRDANILKIADLGLASVHGRDSRSNVPPSTVVASPTYSPPEFRRGHPVSRKWDIWSLGCLYLEFITYLILGNTAITEFSSRRQRSTDIPELRTDAFYTEDAQTINPGVTSWVTHLKENQRCSRAMHDILDLVMDRMIIIQPGSRSTSFEVSQKLKKILNLAENDEDYLLNSKPLAEKYELNSQHPLQSTLYRSRSDNWKPSK